MRAIRPGRGEVVGRGAAHTAPPNWDPPDRNVLGEVRALTAISAIPPYWRRWLHLYVGLRQRLPPAVDWRLVRPLVDLSFIHFARWVVIRALPSNPPAPPERLRHDYLLFESNFNGRWDEYIDAFSYVLGPRMGLLWKGAYGYPGTRPAEPFKAYIRRHEFETDHYFCAYPQATVTQIEAARTLAEKLPALRRAAERSSPEVFVARLRSAVSVGDSSPRPQARRPPSRAQRGVETLNVITPVLPERVSELRDLLRSYGPDGSPFEQLEGTHFARWVVLDELPGPGRDADALRSPLLLFSSTFDGPVNAYLEAIASRLPEVADDVWGRCAGWSGSVAADPGAFVAYLRRNSIETALFFAPYGDLTVGRVRAVLDQQARLQGLLEAARWHDPDALRARFRAELGSPDGGTP